MPLGFFICDSSSHGLKRGSSQSRSSVFSGSSTRSGTEEQRRRPGCDCWIGEKKGSEGKTRGGKGGRKPDLIFLEAQPGDSRSSLRKQPRHRTCYYTLAASIVFVFGRKCIICVLEQPHQSGLSSPAPDFPWSSVGRRRRPLGGFDNEANDVFQLRASDSQ